MSKDNRELCILCKTETPYHFSTDIEYRSHFVEGAGQLCKQCWDKTYENLNK